MTLAQHTEEAFEKVRTEFARQEKKYGYQYHSTAEWAMITSEEFGEAIKATNDKDLVDLATELIDTIACALHWYDETRRQQKGLADGRYTEVNILANGQHVSEAKTASHLESHPPFRLSSEHPAYEDVTPNNMFIGVEQSDGSVVQYRLNGGNIDPTEDGIL